jgi:hypothetical protein
MSGSKEETIFPNATSTLYFDTGLFEEVQE